VSTWDDLDPEEIRLVRQAVDAGEPITDVRLAPAAISEAERVRRRNRAAWARLIAIAVALLGVAVWELSGGHLLRAALAGTVGVLMLAYWRWQSPATRRAAITKASAEQLLRDEGP
jgi:hypothetical protein